MFAITLSSFIFFTFLVAFGTWLLVRKRENSSQDGFFLAGRSLTFPVIAGSLLLTNLEKWLMVQRLPESLYQPGRCPRDLL